METRTDKQKRGKHGPSILLRAGPPASAAGTLPPSQRHSQHPQQSGAQGPVESNHAEPQTSGNP